MTALHVDSVYFKRAIKQARKYVQELGEDLAGREPDDRELSLAITAVAQRSVDNLLQDLRWHLDDTRTSNYEVFERALLEAMGEDA